MPNIGGALSFIATLLPCGAGLFFFYPQIEKLYAPIAPVETLAAAAVLIAAAFVALNFKKWFSGYAVDGKGVRLSVLGITLRFVEWERVKEVRYALYGASSLLFISETPLDGFSYREIMKIKSQITVMCYLKVLSAIKEFYKGEIINYPSHLIIA
ncbi:MAG: hypothetical protein LBP79_04015 [Clostridiales bacterium]|nr:hypothetical protein [Clostridiales bacterium]